MTGFELPDQCTDCASFRVLFAHPSVAGCTSVWAACAGAQLPGRSAAWQWSPAATAAHHSTAMRLGSSAAFFLGTGRQQGDKQRVIRLGSARSIGEAGRAAGAGWRQYRRLSGMHACQPNHHLQCYRLPLHRVGNGRPEQPSALQKLPDLQFTHHPGSARHPGRRP